jgi:hypothetical protein
MLPPLASVLCQMNPVHTLPPYLRFTLVFSRIYIFVSKRFAALRYSNQNRGHISHLLSVYCMSYLKISDFINIIICDYDLQLCSLSLHSLFQPYIMSSIFDLNIVLCPQMPLFSVLSII